MESKEFRYDASDDGAYRLSDHSYAAEAAHESSPLFGGGDVADHSCAWREMPCEVSIEFEKKKKKGVRGKSLGA